MDTLLSDESRFARVVQRVDPHCRLIKARRLAGGLSAEVTALEVLTAEGETRRWVVRRHGAADLAENPNIAADEFRLLHLARSAGVPAPAPYHVDASGEIFPTPYIVVEYIEGAMEFSPQPADLPDFLRQIAAALAHIHRADGRAEALAFLPRVKAQTLGERPARLDETLREGQIRSVLEPLHPLEALNPPALLHGDFWLGNLLWRNGRLAGVIDWEDAKVGDPLIDFAVIRLEILWAFGQAAMAAFTDAYQGLMPGLHTDHLPYWDLRAALRPMLKIGEWAAGWVDFGRPDVTEAAMREGHRWFVDQALAKLGTLY